MIRLLSGLLLLLTLTACGGEASPPTASDPGTGDGGRWLQHDLQVTLNPDSGRIDVTDRLSTELAKAPRSFALNAAFAVEVNGQPMKPSEVQGMVAVYRLRADQLGDAIDIRYSGDIASTDDCDWLRQSCRLLSARGAYLDAGSLWYPQVPDAMHRFRLRVTLPEGWHSLSQGERAAENDWQESQPQDDIYLLAGPFTVYQSEADGHQALVYLQQPDEALAQTYLDATHRYLKQYSDMLGDYPYGKFATVESFWETGWGMPSFTLLGPQVLRLPFIPYTSFPHEILHNWWGNSVFIDARHGNWAEGLTAYLSDHLSQAQRGTDAGYRRDGLQKFLLFTRDGKDFPLEQFRSRHDETTQSVGYSKSMMLFHMLRKDLGDDRFFAGLRSFYEDYRFRSARFRDLQTSMEAVAEKPLGAFFDQWLQRRGAPLLALTAAGPSIDGGFQLTLQQSQTSAPFALNVPVKLTLENGQEERRVLPFGQREQTFTIDVPGTVREVVVDPDYDLMRLPHSAELPASLNRLRAGPTLQVLQGELSSGQSAVVEEWLESLKQRGLRVKRLTAPTERDASPLLIISPAGDDTALPITADEIRLPDQTLPRKTHSAVMTVDGAEQPTFVLTAPNADSLVSLLRKMPHYGKYSYIVFDGDQSNVAKGQWPVTRSPMVWRSGQDR